MENIRNSSVDRMPLIKKTVRILFLLSMILGLASLVMLVLFNFAGVFTIKTIEGTKYAIPFTYPGWQSIFYGVGDMIIQGYTEFTFDIWTCIGLFFPFLALIICSSIYLSKLKKRGTNKIKAVLEFVMAFSLIVGGILLFNCDLLSIDNASKVTNSYQDYYNQYLLPAIDGEEYFKKEAYPLVLFLVCLFTSVIKIGNGLILLLQKKYAKKGKTQISIAENKN